MWRLALTLVLLICPAGPALACRLALALGFDVSRSVDAQDYRVQIDGIVAALFDAEVRRLILMPPDPVAVAVFEWAGVRDQTLVADWRLLASAADIDRLAEDLLRRRRADTGLTAVGAAVAAGEALLARAPGCLWQVLDLSGDGQNNEGPMPVPGRPGVVVNGLAIGGHETGILAWFHQHVARGPGAFVEYAPRHADFAATFRRKLIRELTPPLLGALE